MRVFFAPWRQPVMHSPHSVHALRAGPAPPKYGSGASRPGAARTSPVASSPSPKNTPTGAMWKVSPTPIFSAAALRWTSEGVMVLLRRAPSMRRAWS